MGKDFASTMWPHHPIATEPWVIAAGLWQKGKLKELAGIGLSGKIQDTQLNLNFRSTLHGFSV